VRQKQEVPPYNDTLCKGGLRASDHLFQQRGKSLNSPKHNLISGPEQGTAPAFPLQTRDFLLGQKLTDALLGNWVCVEPSILREHGLECHACCLHQAHPPDHHSSESPTIARNHSHSGAAQMTHISQLSRNYSHRDSGTEALVA
jgi:hypothetical protein